MLRMNGTDVPKKRRSPWCLPYLVGGLALAGAAVAEQAETADANEAERRGAEARTTYRIINLGPGQREGAVINASGQVAFSVFTDFDSPIRAWFYDGTAARDIGTLGGPFANVTGLNDAGQVVGASYRDSAASGLHAFVWSTGSGMVDIGTLPGATYTLYPVINNRGEVAGDSGGIPTPYPHAFRWTAAGGMENLGGLMTGADSISYARAINDAGLIAGNSLTTTLTGAYAYHAFAWTRSTGMIDIDTLGNGYSVAVAVGAKGQVAGNFFVRPVNYPSGFIWTRASGMRALGTGGICSEVRAMSASGQVAGDICQPGGLGNHAMTWTQAGGMVDLGTLGGTRSFAFSANNKGQVVGGALTTNDDEVHAFVWTAKDGMIDLNKRLRDAPAGLTLFEALAISDNGSIVANSNAGLVLLTLRHGQQGGHAVGPIAAADLAQVGAPFDASVSFAAEDPAAKHNVIWSWGDGSGDRAGNARARNGAGSASGSHTYTTPGIYMVTANVVDLAGKSAAVSRNIIAYDPSSGFAGGTGSFMSPHWMNKAAPIQAGRATFSFVSPSMTSARAISPKAQLHFNVGRLSFHSKDLRPVAMQGARGQFEGSGTINGAGDYKFTMATTAGGAAGEGERGRFSLRIWHIDPATREEVVDYDNQGTGSSAAGDPIVEGRIAVQQ